MAGVTPTEPAVQRTSSPDTNGPIGPADARPGRGGLLPWGLRRWGDTRLLALGLAACVASSAVWSPLAAVQPAAAQVVNPLAGQVPTPTLTATPQPVVVGPLDLFPTPVPTQAGFAPVRIQVNTPTVPLDVTLPTPQAALPTSSALVACAGPDYIFQKCTLSAGGTTAPVAPGRELEPLRRLEAQAIASVLQQYQLPESERARVLRYARGEVRAALFTLVTQAFQKEPGARGADERLLVDAFTQLVRAKHVETATSAQNWYRIWAANPCDFTPPSGFTYDRPTECASPLAGAFSSPSPPSLETLQAYGAATAYDTDDYDAETARVFGGTATGALAAYGLAAAAGAGAAGAAIGAALPVASVTAFVISPSLSGVVPVTTTVAAGASGALAVGGAVTAVIAAVVIGVTQGMRVAADAAIPGQLQEALDTARSYDLGAALRGDNSETRKAAQQELFAAFIPTTLPDYPGTDPAPAALASDPRLVVAGRPVDWLQYTADDGTQRAVRLSGRWLADRPASAGAGEARLKLQLNYRDAAEAAWTASRVGNQFLIVRVGDPAAADYPAPRQSADLSVVDGNGRTVTARVGS